MRRFLLVMSVVAIASPPALATSYLFCPDVPTDDPSGASAAIYLPWDVARNDSGAYSLVTSFPQGTPVDGLHRMCNGDWLISVETPTTLGATTYDPRDVVRYSPGSGTWSLAFGGAAAGVPVGSDVDAVFLVGGDASDLVLSFDVPTRISATTYEPADLVRWSGGAFSLYFDASAASPPVPDAVNVTGADRRGSLSVLTFDVPATLTATHLPGELVSWDGTAFASLYADPGWRTSSRLDAWSFLPDPGDVSTMLIGKSLLVPGGLRIAWGMSASAGAEDYGIYEGTLGTWYSHTAIDCSDNGSDRVEEVVPGAGDRYFLVVASNPDLEGSYGRHSNGTERPMGSPSACRAAQGFDCP